MMNDNNSQFTTHNSPLKNGYKKTEIGIIPEDWGVNKLGGIVLSIVSGKSNTKSQNGDFPIYGSTGIIGYQSYFDYEGKKNLIARVGANAGTVNKVKGKYCVSDNTLMISYNKILNIDFAFFQLKNLKLNTLVFGSGQPLITGGQLKNIKIPLPPLPEQKAIAEVLSDTDELIQTLEKQIAKKRMIKQGAMQVLLSPPATTQMMNGELSIVNEEEKWEVKKLGEIAEIRKGNALSKNKISENGKHPCLLYGELFTTYKEVINSIVSRTDFEEGIKSKYGDILFPGSTTTSGIDLAKASALLFDNVLLGGDIIIVRNQIDYNSVFLSYFLNQVCRNVIAKKTKGITIHHLYRNDLLDIEINLPSNQEQTRIATILSDMDSEIEILESKLSKYKKIKQGTMQELLTGKIRLMVNDKL